MTQPSVDVAPFLERLDEESGLYDAMKALSERELQAPAGEDDATAMLERVAEKQRLIARIDRIETEIRPIKEGWTRLRERVGPDQREEAERRMRAMRDTIKELIEMEARWNESLTAGRDETAAQLKKLEQVRKTGAAYRVAGTGPDPRFMDRAR